MKKALIILFFFQGTIGLAQDDIFCYGTYAGDTSFSSWEFSLLEKAIYDVRSIEIYREEKKFLFFKVKEIYEKYDFYYELEDLKKVYRIDYGYRRFLKRNFCNSVYFFNNSRLDSVRKTCSFIKNSTMGSNFHHEGNDTLKVYSFYNNKISNYPLGVYEYNSQGRLLKKNTLLYKYDRKFNITSVENKNGKVYELLIYDSIGLLKEHLFNCYNNGDYFEYKTKCEYEKGNNVKIIVDKLDSNGLVINRVGEVRYQYYSNGKLKEVDILIAEMIDLYKENYFYYSNGLIKELHHYNKRKKLNYKLYYKYTYVKD